MLNAIREDSCCGILTAMQQACNRQQLKDYLASLPPHIQQPIQLRRPTASGILGHRLTGAELARQAKRPL